MTYSESEVRDAARVAKADFRRGGFFERYYLKPEDYPFHVMERSPNGQWRRISGYKTFMEAYNSPAGTHVLQTHGTAAQVEQQVGGMPSRSVEPSIGETMARRAMGGYLLAGPAAAAFGASTTPRVGREYYLGGKLNELYELPDPILSAKPVREAPLSAS
jgi:hypothetical protein